MEKVTSIALLEDLYLLAKQEDILEAKLGLYQFVASCFWHNYSNTYSNRYLEDDLIVISNKIIDFELPEYLANNSVLHVMTEAYAVGGHTRVVDNWIKSSPQNVHSVLINNHLGNCPEFLADTVKKSGGQIILNTSGYFIDKAKFLAKTASTFKYIVLHHHPHDILPLLAFGSPKYTRPIFFYNHADHAWGCGYSVCDRILEISGNGAGFSHKYRGISSDRSLPVGIPLEFLNNTISTDGIYPKTVVSMANSTKYHPTAKYNFQEFIENLLEVRTDVICEIIGVKPDDNHWNGILNRYPDRIKLYGELPKDIATEILGRATLYIDSFPMPSFTSFIQALNLGIPAISLVTTVSTIDCYTAELTAVDVNDLLAKCCKIIDYTKEERQNFICQTLPQVKAWHDLKSFANKIGVLDNIHDHDPLKIGDAKTHDEYSAFFYEVLKQDCFKFDAILFAQIFYSHKQKICRILAKYGLLYESRPLNDGRNILELMDGLVNYTQLFIATVQKNEFTGEVVYAMPLNYENKYTFDLTLHTDITSIRFDPIDQPGAVRLIYARLKLKAGGTFNLDLKSHNGEKLADTFNFRHDDSQFIFDIPENLSNSVMAVEICADISPCNRLEIVQLNRGLSKQVSDLSQQVSYLEQKIFTIKNVSRKITGLSGTIRNFVRSILVKSV